VDQVHEQSDPGSLEQPFGKGEMPRVLWRFNWGAFLLPLFWGLTYGSWQVTSAWGVGLMTPLVLSLMFATGDAQLPLNSLIAITVISEVVVGVLRLWVGVNANRWVWNREALRLQVLTGATPRFSAERYIKRQRTWTTWGAIVVIAGFAVAVPFSVVQWREFELTYVGAAAPVVWLAAEVMLGLWLDARMRAEPPDAEAAAREIS
jgi:hypothetical protein